jgi:hypothetical protein
VNLKLQVFEIVAPLGKLNGGMVILKSKGPSVEDAGA